MSSNEPSSRIALNLEADVPTTPADVEALRRLRRNTPSWLSLTPGELEELLPADALDRRPPTARWATPFELP